MNHSFALRTQGMSTSIFSEISMLARKHDAVNLGQGFPDYDTPDSLKQCAIEAIQQGKNQYSIGIGERILRHAIARHAVHWYGLSFDPDDEITVTSGATEAILCSILALVNPGDEVIVFQPYYDSYCPAIRMAGGIPVAVTLHAPHFSFNPMELAQAFSPKTKAIIINTPHNPTGTVFSLQELQFIAELCNEYHTIAICDEVYEHCVYDGITHVPMQKLPSMTDKTVRIGSMGKTFTATGWKIGWAIGSADFQRALRSIHQFVVFASATPFQYAAAAALGADDITYRNFALDLQKKRDYLFSVLERLGLQPYKPSGSYFILCDIAGITHLPSAEFAKKLITELGVAAIPPESFYHSPEIGSRLLRFCFCKHDDTLHKAAERLSQLSTILS